MFIRSFIYLALCTLSTVTASEPSDVYQIEYIPLPEGEVIEVSAIAELDDQRVAISTRRGEIWIGEGLYEDTIGKVTWTRFAYGLHEGFGLFQREDGDLIVTQRGEVTQLKDTNGDGKADRFLNLCNAWGNSKDYHEFAFSTKPDREGNIWMALCLTGSVNSAVPFRGWAVRVTPEGELIPTTSGIRSPGGIGFDQAGTAFCTDNQGFWNGSSSLKPLLPDTFVGHPDTIQWYDHPLAKQQQLTKPDASLFPMAKGTFLDLYEKRKECPQLVPPAVVFPHAKLGQSPTGITTDLSGGKFGPFSRQLLVGEVSHSQVQRVMLEKVNGVYQGAVINLLSGLNFGVVPVEMNQEKGYLFLGGTNRGWGSRGKEPYGLARVKWTGQVPFEIQDMKAAPEGFRFRFTQPIDQESLENIAGIKLSAYTYHLGADYGSPEIKLSAPKVREVHIGEDKKTAYLKIDGLVPGHVHEFTFDELKSAEGSPLRQSSIYYTLNEIPEKDPLFHTGSHKGDVITAPLHRQPEVVPAQYDGTPEPAPEGAVSLFNGADLNLWQRWKTQDKENPSTAPTWTIKPDKSMTVNPRTGGIQLKENLLKGSGHLHIEWKSPAKVVGSGQGRGNSGVMIEGFPEVQVLDCYQNETYPTGMTGALYTQRPPLVNACRKPGEWQKYDIYITRAVLNDQGKPVAPASIKVFHNNVLIQEHLECAPRLQEGGLKLQDHLNEVSFRNIWFRPAFTLSAAESPLKLEYDRPSRTWDEYLPVGNGSMGAMVSGRPDMEHLQLNEMTLWSGGPNPVDKTACVGSPEIFQKGHQLFREGQMDEAKEVLKKVMGLRGNRSYEALGDLKLAFTHSLRNAKNYRRELDLNDAMVRISYEDQGATFTREVFASYPDRAIVVRLTANKKNKISFEAKLDRERGASTQSIGSDTLVMRGQTAADGLTFESRVRIVNTGGTVKADANLIRVSDADEVLIFIVAGTNYKDPYSLGEDPAIACEKSLSHVSAKTWDELKQRHLKDYQALFNRVTLDLGGEEKATQPISERLAAMQEWAKTYKASGYQDGAVSPDPQLISLLFQYGRYILISCSREGAVPANLQGIWSEDITNPAWSSSYTLDINLEQNYWPSDVANLSECAEPLYQFIEAFVPAGTKIARDVYGARGWVLGLRTDAFAGAVIGGSKSIMTWTFGSGWLCRHLMERYNYSGDAEFLRNRAYPLMKGAAQFYLDTLVEAPQGTSVAGKLVMFPSTSPENTFTDRDGKKGHITYGSAMDTQIMLELFQNCLESQQILKMDSAEELAFRQELEQAMAKLQPYQVSKTDGRLLEWPEEFKEQHSGHRHLSHLYALYPGDTINASTPKLLEAARKSLEVRTSGGGGGTGWSEGWVAPLWARLGDGDRAAFAYDRMLGTLMNNNMFNQCPSSKGAQRYPEYWWEDLDYVMQVEGNLAVSGGLPELLVQSHLRNPDGSFMIDLLPALPDGWPTGSVTGLRVRGGFEMDIEWAAGKLKQASVSCISGGTGTLRYGDKIVKLDMQPGQQLNFSTNLDEQ